MKNLIGAVNEVMKAAKSVSKNSEVGSGRNSYKGVKDLDVKQLTQPLLARHSLAIFQTSMEVTSQHDTWEVTYNGQQQRKKQVFTEVKCKYILMHSSGESIELTSLGHGVDSQDKSAGKAMTYALKMLLLYTFLIPSGQIDDTDDTHSDDYESPVKQEKKPAPKQSVKKEAPKQEKPKTTPAQYVINEITGETASTMSDEQKQLLAESILLLPKEERRAWIGVSNNWTKDQGASGLLAELNAIHKKEPSTRKSRLNELALNQLPF